MRGDVYLAAILGLMVALAAGPAAAVPATYAYDAAGRLTLDWVGNARVVYAYDVSGNLLSQTACVADCYIDGACRGQGDVDPADVCQVCDGVASREAWSVAANCMGADMGVDMGGGSDMGAAPDLGVADMGGPGPDSGSPNPDMATEPDSGGADSGSPRGPEDKGGCSCRVGGQGSLDAWPLLLFGMLLVGRRRRRSTGIAGGAATLLVAFGVAPPAHAVSVCQDGSCDYTSITQGISNSAPGETISVKPGAYMESDLRLLQGRNLVSTTPNDPSGVVIDAQRSAAVISQAGDSLIRGVTLRNGYAPGAPGGGIRATSGMVVVQNVIVEDSESDSSGGGIGTNSAASLTLVDSVIRNNQGRIAGGGIGGGFRNLIIVNCRIENNVVVGTNGASGGGVSAPSSTLGGEYFEMRGTIVEGNRAVSNVSTATGGGVATQTPISVISNSTFTNNTLQSGGVMYGGGISLGTNANAQVSYVTVNGNTAGRGGGIYIAAGGGNVVLLGGSVSANSALTVGDGGGVYCAGTGRLAGISSVVSGNSPDQFAGPCFGGCVAATTQACTTDQPGVCAAGQQVCDAAGNWGVCAPVQVATTAEMMCTGGLDEDCDGKIDGADPDCQPARPTTRAQVGGTSGRRKDPVNTFTGEFYTRLAPDLDLGGPLGVAFTRYYASGLDALGLSGAIGTNWRHNYEWSLLDSGSSVTITDAEGRLIEFEIVGSRWELANFTDVSFALAERGADFVLWDPRTRRYYTFDGTGPLTQISDGTSSALVLTYAGGSLSQVTDGRGRTLSFTYAGAVLTAVGDGTRSVSFARTGANLTGVIDVLANPTSYAYDANGLLTSMTLAAGNVPLTQVGANGRVASQVDGAGDTTTFAYDDLAGTCQITDPLGTVTHTHDGRGRLEEIAWSSGDSWTFGYDVAGRRTTVTDEGGASSRSTFQGQHRVSRELPDGLMLAYDLVERYHLGAFVSEIGAIHYPDGNSETFTYNSSGDLLSMTDRAGGTARFEYNEYGQTTVVTNQAGGTTNYAYDANGLLASMIDNAGNITTYTYDAALRRTGVTMMDGSTRTTVYDDADRIATITDERGMVLAFSYDDNGNLVASQDGEGQVTTLGWDGLDRVASYADPLGFLAMVTYDARGRVNSQTNRDGSVTSLERDLDGRVTALVDGGGERWTRAYDASGRLAVVTDPLGNMLAYERDLAGRVTLVRSPLGHETTLVYDAMGRVASITDPLGGVSTTSYDARGFVDELMTPGGVVASYTRNALGQVTVVTAPGGADWSFEYDPAGRLLSRTDPVGNQITRTFDTRNRPVNFVLPGGLGTVDVTYDGFGNVVSQVYSAGPSLNFAYDGRNLLTTAEGLTLGYDANGLVTSSNGLTLTRDAIGRIDVMTYPAGDVRYVYDSADNLVRITDWLGQITTFEYDAAGRRTLISRPNGVATRMSYDADNRVTGVVERIGAATLSSITLQRDGRGNTVSADRNIPMPPSIPADAALTYDAASQVSSYSYDALGRVIADDRRSYTWDGASRLQGYSEGGAAVTFAHDGLLQVTSRTEAGVTDEYVWNHATTRPSIAVIRRAATDRTYYVHTPDGELLYSIDAATSASHFYHFDEVGSTVLLTDDVGVVSDAYGYSAYGELTASMGATPNPFTYVGRYSVVQSGDTGLYLMGRRFYDAVSKRFVSREPVVDMLHPDTINPYTYAAANPLAYIDPTGEANEDARTGEPTPDGVKTVLKAHKVATTLVGSRLDEVAQRSADVMDAARAANDLNRVSGGRNPQWVDAALDHSKKLKKYKGMTRDLGRAGKYLGLAAAGSEDGAQALAEFGATELADKIGGAKAGAIVGIGIEAVKTKQRVDKVQSQLKDDQWSNYENYRRALDNSWESYRLKLITEEEFVRRVVAAQEAFELSVRGSKDNGVFGILEESARGLNDMLWNLL